MKTVALYCSVFLCSVLTSIYPAAESRKKDPIIPAILTETAVGIELFSQNVADFLSCTQEHETPYVVHIYLPEDASKDLFFTDEDIARFAPLLKAVIITNNASPDAPQIYFKSSTSGKQDCSVCGLRVAEKQNSRDELPPHICVVSWPASSDAIKILVARCNATLESLGLSEASTHLLEDPFTSIPLENEAPTLPPSSSRDKTISTLAAETWGYVSTVLITAKNRWYGTPPATASLFDQLGETEK